MELGFLFADLFGKPAWIWLAFLSIVVALLAFDLGVLHKQSREIGARESLVMSAVYIGLGLAFGPGCGGISAPNPAWLTSPASPSRRRWRWTTCSSSP